MIIIKWSSWLHIDPKCFSIFFFFLVFPCPIEEGEWESSLIWDCLPAGISIWCLFFFWKIRVKKEKKNIKVFSHILSCRIHGMTCLSLISTNPCWLFLTFRSGLLDLRSKWPKGTYKTLHKHFSLHKLCRPGKYRNCLSGSEICIQMQSQIELILILSTAKQATSFFISVRGLKHLKKRWCLRFWVLFLTLSYNSLRGER